MEITRRKKIIEIKSQDKAIRDKKNSKRGQIIGGIVWALILSIVFYFISGKGSYAGVAFLVSLALIETYFFVKQILKRSLKVKAMENVFPDFIELMASNLRAGMTIDKALLFSSRKEFSPLDEEILALGKDILTGKEISIALLDMARRIKSDKILKTIGIINSGIRSGGNLAILLEKTAINLRERGFVEKRAASNVLMYVIFIFFAVAVGAPILFSLSSVLVEVLTSILGNIPDVSVNINSPISLTKISISSNFIIYFSMFFLAVIDILASLLLGLVDKGDEKQGLKYTAPLIAVSLIVFFVVRTLLMGYFSGLT